MIAGNGSFTSDPGDIETHQYIWGTNYIDELVYYQRDLNTNGSFNDDASGQHYVLRDRNYSVIGVATGNEIERIRYTPYGESQVQIAADVTGEGVIDVDDFNAILAAIGGTIDGSVAGYTVEADINRDGVVDIDDLNVYLSAPTGSVPENTVGYNCGNIIGYAGYVFEEEIGLYLVRHRWYGPKNGRWNTRDWLDRKTAHLTNYNYCDSSSLVYADPFGLFRVPNPGPAIRQYCATSLDSFERNMRNQLTHIDFAARPESAVALFSLFAQMTFSELSQRDREHLSIFQNTQICILGAIPSCASCSGAYRAGDGKWIANVTRDFMRPYIQSLCERSFGLTASDAGWRAFFGRLDSGRIKSKLSTKFIAWQLEVSREMALNHINNDLRISLARNGIGGNNLWRCIGDEVEKCQARILGGLNAGSALLGKYHEDFDVQSIRDRMRREISPNGTPVPNPTPTPVLP